MRKSDRNSHREQRRLKRNKRNSRAGSYGTGRTEDRQGHITIRAEMARAIAKSPFWRQVKKFNTYVTHMELPTTKIISGGQTGADQAGLIAGKALLLDTGGTMPKGFRTLDGPRKNFAGFFGMTESPHASYAIRTANNVWDSNGTIRFATDWDSPGEYCTKKWISEYGKPSIDVDMRAPRDPQDVRDWLVENKIKILNVAGNSERTSPGIEIRVTKYLQEVFDAE